MNSEQDKISVIIPVYNIDKYLEKCLESVSNQIYKNIEIIIVDDGSTDSSSDIYERYAQIDHRFRIFKKTNGGLSSARNFGINQSSGKYVYFLDGDDRLPIDSLKVLHDDITKNNSSISTGDINIIGDSDIKLGIPKKTGKYERNIDNLFNDYLFQLVAVNRLYKLDFLKSYNLSFYEGIYHEDILWSYNIAMKIESFSYVKHITYFYIIRNSSITQTKTQKNIDCLKIIIQIIFNDLKFNSSYFFNERRNFLEMLCLNCMNDQRMTNSSKLVDLRDELSKYVHKNLIRRITNLDIKGAAKILIYYIPPILVDKYLNILFKKINK